MEQTLALWNKLKKNKDGTLAKKQPKGQENFGQLYPPMTLTETFSWTVCHKVVYH